MFQSLGFRFIIVSVLALLMSIPLFFAGEIIDARATYSRQTGEAISHEWGGPQIFSGPQLVIPVEAPVTHRRQRPVLDPSTGQPRKTAEGQELLESYDETLIERQAPVYIYPDNFTLTLTSTTEERHRGIFVVPVFQSRAEMSFDFPAEKAGTVVSGEEVLLWDKAELRVFVTDNRALRGRAELVAAGQPIGLEPLAGGEQERAGVFAALGDPRGLGAMTLDLGFNGAQSVMATPVGRNSTVTIVSDWPDPSFWGAFLPNESEVSDKGFTASWTIPHLARNLPQVGRADLDRQSRSEAAFGVRFFQPNDFYQKAFRAARYGLLFIAMTFLTVLLIDRTSARPAHPVQYLLIGLAQSIFVLLMVAYAEQIGFGLAYLVSSTATVGLIVMFGALAMKLGRRAWVLLALLVVLYAVLYLILQSTDYALLAGATLAFFALAATMFMTRNESWYGEGGGRNLLWEKLTAGTGLDRPAAPDPSPRKIPG